jgi:hypothetical protein
LAVGPVHLTPGLRSAAYTLLAAAS